MPTTRLPMAASEKSIESVAPLFVKDNDIGESVTPIQVCDAIVNVISDTELEGVQKVNNLWRIY